MPVNFKSDQKNINMNLTAIYSIYSQPITTRYMQIGKIEAKYKEKKKKKKRPSQSIPL